MHDLSGEQYKKLEEYESDFDNRMWLEHFAECNGGDELETLMEYFEKGEWNDEETKEMLERFRVQQAITFKWQREEQQKVDYSDAVVAGSFAADQVSGSDE